MLVSTAKISQENMTKYWSKEEEFPNDQDLLPDQKSWSSWQFEGQPWVAKVRQIHALRRRRNRVYNHPFHHKRKTCKTWETDLVCWGGVPPPLGHERFGKVELIPLKIDFLFGNFLFRKCLVSHHHCKCPTGSQQQRWLTQSFCRLPIARPSAGGLYPLVTIPLHNVLFLQYILL